MTYGILSVMTLRRATFDLCNRRSVRSPTHPPCPGVYALGSVVEVAARTDPYLLLISNEGGSGESR